VVIKIKNRKKADLSVNTIVVAILALVVLFVLILIFSKQSVNFRQGLNDCESKQGLCRSKASCDTDKGQILSFKCNTANKDDVCCYLSCESQKGRCTTKADCTTTANSGINYLLYTNCDDKAQVCCFNK